MAPIQPKMTLVRGVSGSGKSTFADYIMSAFGLVFSADDYFTDGWGGYDFDPSLLPLAHEDCQKRARNAMEYGADFAVANTFTQEWEMEPYFKLAEEYGYCVFVVIVENRHGGQNEHGVPEEKVQEMRDRFEVKL